MLLKNLSVAGYGGKEPSRRPGFPQPSRSAMPRHTASYATGGCNGAGGGGRWDEGVGLQARGAQQSWSRHPRRRRHLSRVRAAITTYRSIAACRAINAYRANTTYQVMTIHRAITTYPLGTAFMAANDIFRRVRARMHAHACVHVCMRACVRACVRARACVRCICALHACVWCV